MNLNGPMSCTGNTLAFYQHVHVMKTPKKSVDQIFITDFKNFFYACYYKMLLSFMLYFSLCVPPYSFIYLFNVITVYGFWHFPSRSITSCGF